MITNILLYLLAGTVFSFIVEVITRAKGEDFTSQERFSIITFWPIMMLIFTFHFIKAFLK
jgi:hypothetical protein|tara:strand:- start:250 stop:429 length:180 start_codon:yes stop_codon:yes gene_type:complete